METYRLSSKLRDQEHEYLIQTANDVSIGSVATAVYIDGVLAETLHQPHDPESSGDEVMSLVRATHDQRKREVETLLTGYRRILHEGDPGAMYQCAQALYYRGFFGEARELLIAATDRARDLHQAFDLLSACELAIGHSTEAVKAAAAAVGLRPTFADYRNNYGEALLAENAPQRAVEQFEAAIGINLYYADAYFHRGIALLQSAAAGENKDVDVLPRIQDSFRKASLILPEYSSPAFEAGLAAVNAHDITRALRCFREVRTLRKERRRHELANLHARVPVHFEEFSEEALADRIAAVSAEIARNPLYPDLHAELAQCYIEEARVACRKATDHFRKAVSLNPSLSQNHIACDQAEDLLQRMNSVASRIAEKG